MRLRRTAILLVRATGPDVLRDGVVVASGYPAVPATWEVIGQDIWTELRKLNGQVFHALRLNTWTPDPAQGVWLVVQREPSGAAGLTALAARAGVTYAGRLKPTWIAARAGAGVERQVIRHVPTWLISGTEPDGDGGTKTITREARRVIREGQRVPTGFITGAGPWTRGSVTVTAAHRPAIGREIAGYDDSTPEDGTPER